MTLRQTFVLWVVAALTLATPALGFARDIRTERVQFKQGANSAIIEGKITGYETVDYVLVARAGQSMNVSMSTDNDANYFNIFPPGENEVAMFNGATSGNRYEGVLPETGDYKVRVYLMRSAARRKEVARYRLEMIVAAGGNRSDPSGDALVPGTPYHATGEIPCAMGRGQPTGPCPFGVKRQGNGSGLVTVTKPDRRTRAIVFRNGQPTGYDESEADRGAFSVEKQNDLSIIHIGDERYEIPDAVIWGG